MLSRQLRDATKEAVYIDLFGVEEWDLAWRYKFVMSLLIGIIDLYMITLCTWENSIKMKRRKTSDCTLENFNN